MSDIAREGRGLRPAVFVALLLALMVAGLTPLAQLHPIDPTWFAGFWDDGDFDDVVLIICGIAAELPALPAPPRIARAVVATVRLSEPAKPAFPAVASAFSRAPPRA